MRRLLVFILVFSVSAAVFAQQNVSAPQKFALVIGNGNYAHTTKLNNPVNDARDIASALQGLGWTVDILPDAGQEQMENAAIRLKNRLSSSPNSYGFFFFAGHGVQSNGENFLIPVDANIQSESFLRSRAVSVQAILDELNSAGNELNIVILDACRDNPYSWRRSGTRGLSIVGHQPADSIIMYATAAGSTASDGTGRNGLFTTHLLNNLKTPGLEVAEIFRLTMGDVARASNNQQRPAVYNQFSGQAYLGSRPSPNTSTGNIAITSEIAGEILIDGVATGSKIKAGGTITVLNISTGATEIAVKGDNGSIIKHPEMIMVRQGQTVSVEIRIPIPAPYSVDPSDIIPGIPANFVRINGGTFTMGSPANEVGRNSNEAQRQVTVNSFYMCRHEVTQKEYQEIMGYNPSNFKGDNLPVERVSWYEAIEYCNKRSQKEGLTPAYIIDKNNKDKNNTNGDDTLKWTVTWNKSANGYRLPTEAEWEYACRAGTTTAYNTGATIRDSTGWYYANSNNRTQPVGQKPANAWGLHDTHGNVNEWCWDWYGDYTSGTQTNPAGAVSGYYRVIRGGNWQISGQYLRSACRFFGFTYFGLNDIGFRVVRP